MKTKKKILILLFITFCISYSCENGIPEISVVSVSVSENSVTITEGDIEYVKVKVSPDNATNKNVSWKSSDALIASVDQQGKVTANKAGNAIITVTTGDGNKTASCAVTVEPRTISVISVFLNKTSLNLTEGESGLLTFSIFPLEATNKNVSWKSSDALIASVDQQGKVTANKAGNAIITVTTEDGNKTASCTVTVEPKTISVTGISLNKTLLTLIAGDNEQLTFVIEPADATNKNVSWKSSDALIASLDQQGKVTANKAGKATVTVTTEDGNKTASCAVTVEPRTISVISVSLNKTSLNLTEGESGLLTFSIFPLEATNKNVSWKSSDALIASVDQQGKVTANKAGNAIITVTTEDGNKTASCTVTVETKTISVTGISLNKTLLTLIAGDNEQLTFVIEPADATNKNVSWKSSDAVIASVDQQGKVTANEAGKATITVTTEDGNKTASCTITVEPRTISVISVSLNKTSLTLIEGESGLLTFSIFPLEATNKNVSWKSSDALIASVDQQGKVTANKAGNAIVTVTTEDGNKTASCTVTVEPKTISVTGISLNKTLLTLIAGDNEQLTFVIEPADATNKNVSWKSSDAVIASVDQQGKVTANEAGKATVTVTTEDGNKTAACAITVDPKIIPITGVTLNKTTVTLLKGESDILTATVFPEEATDKELIWISSNPAIVSVDTNGKITANESGSATITVKTRDGGKTAMCDVTVKFSWLSISQSDLHATGTGGSFYIDVTASSSWSIISKPYWVTILPSGGTGSETGSERINISVSEYSESPVFRSGQIIFKLNGVEISASLSIDQYNFPFKDGDYVKVQNSTLGNGIDLVFLGDGYTIEDIGDGKFTKNINDAVNHFFDIEPYRTYRHYFDVYFVYAFSEESGISDNYTKRNTIFLSKYETQNSTRMTADNNKCFEYAGKVPLSQGLSETLITLITNSSRYGGTCWMYSDGKAIAISPVSDSSYPYGFKNVVQHEAGGHGFGKLADEYISYKDTIPSNESDNLKLWQQNFETFKNVDVTKDLSTILWKHIINDTQFPYVGAYEGAYLYAYGVWKPEPASLMINNITYINAPGRELIVRRIKKLAGETFSFVEFKSKDIRETQPLTRSSQIPVEKNMILPPPILVRVD